MTARLLGVALIVFSIAPAASAQPRQPPARRPQPRPRTSVVVYGVVGWQTLTARDTFNAVAGTNQGVLFGGGAQVMNIWKRLFVDGAVTQTSLDGERVFVSDGDVFPLGIPLRITMRPIDVAAGWRGGRGRLSPYAGGGATILSYEETSDFADGDDLSEVRVGALLLGGVDYAVHRWLRVGGEVRFRAVPGLLGEGGVSKEFNEKMLGGVDAALRVSVGR